MPRIVKFHVLLARQFEEDNVVILMWAALLYFVFSLFSENSGNSYIESLTIYSGLMFAALISASCDLIKERQYLKLKDEINNQTVTVYRGAYGTCCSIFVRDLVTGDIIDLQAGDRVPADCILIEEMNITCDQSNYFSKDTRVSKETSECFYQQNQDDVDNHKDHPDPFLFADTKIMTG